MYITSAVKKILSYYEADNIGTKTNLSRLLMHGKLGGTGKLIILPVDQGFEHGPARSFAVNPAAYDPHYHYQIAIKAGLSAYAAPLGTLEAGASTYLGEVPLILKMNSANSLNAETNKPDQAILASVKDALRLGCVGVGITIYPGAHAANNMFEEAREIVAEAKSYGLVAVIWSYPRGGAISKAGETALDICAYAGHIAAQLGAHIIKLKPPTNVIEQASDYYNNIEKESLADRVKHVKEACFNGRRLVIFSGGATKQTDTLYQEVREIKRGGGDGLIIGRNSFQRSEADSLAMLQQIVTLLQP